MAATYRAVIVGPGDEVLDTIALDGLDLHQPGHRSALGGLVGAGMGTAHVRACAALPPLDDDGEPLG